MNERRRNRSGQKNEALGLLLAAVKGRSDVTSIAVVDADGVVISGMGTPQELAILGAVAAPASGGTLNPLCEVLTEGTDVMAKKLTSPTGTVYLAALGTRVGRMHDAAKSIERILRVA